MDTNKLIDLTLTLNDCGYKKAAIKSIIDSTIALEADNIENAFGAALQRHIDASNPVYKPDTIFDNTTNTATVKIGKDDVIEEDYKGINWESMYAYKKLDSSQVDYLLTTIKGIEDQLGFEISIDKKSEVINAIELKYQVVLETA